MRELMKVVKLMIENPDFFLTWGSVWKLPEIIRAIKKAKNDEL